MPTLNPNKLTRPAVNWPVCTVLSLTVPLLLPLQALAEGDWRASISLHSEHTDNANKTESDKISERQDEAELGLGGSYANRWVTFSANYKARERRFSESSQADRSVVQGDSKLLVGQSRDPFDLLITHTRRTVLNAPDDIDLLRNNDERTILSAMPSARWRPTDADLMMLQGQYSDVDYRFTPERNSERQGASAVWQRNISEVDLVSLTGLQSQVSFDDFPGADYDYRAASVSYQVNLRHLQYRFQLGYNESRPEVGSGASSPSYQVEVNVGEGANQWELSTSQFITDSSTGSGNQDDLDSFVPGDSTSGRIDQIERTRAEFRWLNHSLCERCGVTASIYWQADDYRMELEDQEERGARLSLTYQLSRQSSADISWQRRDRQFDTSVTRSDFQQDRLRAGYEYQFLSNLSLNVMLARNERRSDDNNREYTENSGGLGLHYTF